jgi:hypothetical protein
LKKMEDLTRLLDEIWYDKYQNEGETRAFEERSHVVKGSPKHAEKGWEANAKEVEEMMEMVLGIMARGWPDGR